jgi:isopenicillin-N epimerase
MHEEGWSGVMATNHALLVRARDHLCERLGTAAPVPDGMLGSMATVLLPAHPAGLAARLGERPRKHHDALQDELMSRHSIEAPIWNVPGTATRFVRISAQLYNSFEQYEYLAEALLEELERERRL